eukprot:scaffold24846_cov33-Attheya_sp.AAC.2
MLLGHLQNNFIGTEFQIFAPIAKKTYFLSPCNSQVSSEYPSREDGDESKAGDESSASQRESPPPQRKRRSCSRCIRRSLSRLRSMGRSMNPESFDEPELRRSQSSSHGRRGSWPSLYNTKAYRASRRAIADSGGGGGGGSSSMHHSNVVGEEEMGGITYTANLLGNCPRIMDVYVPRVSEENVSGVEWRQFCETLYDDNVTNNSMLSRFKQLQQRLENPDGVNDEDGDYGLLALKNRPPWWNIELGAFVLNFGGRLTVASVKNFQLCERNDQDHIMLQFGHIHGRHSFTMDFQYPLTAVQAFAFAISSLQSKNSFG